METSEKRRGRPTAGAFDADLGAVIREARVAAGVTMQEIAGRLGISYQQYFKYEHGANRVSVSRLVQIADVLNISAADLLVETQAGGGFKGPKRATMELMRVVDGLPTEAVSALRGIAQQMRSP